MVVCGPQAAVLGERCELTQSHMATLVGKVKSPVTIIKARAAFAKFEVVPDKSVTSKTIGKLEA